MTATPIQGRAPVVWFLIASDCGSTLRITPGLTLREDAAGRLKLGVRSDEAAWIRFDVEEDALWLTVTTDRFTLVSGKRVLGKRLRLDESLALAMPGTEFQISRSFADRRRAHRTVVRLATAGPHEAAPEPPPLRLLPTQAEPELPLTSLPGHQSFASEGSTLAVNPSAESPDMAAPLPAYAAIETPIRARAPTPRTPDRIEDR